MWVHVNSHKTHKTIIALFECNIFSSYKHLLLWMIGRCTLLRLYGHNSCTSEKYVIWYTSMALIDLYTTLKIFFVVDSPNKVEIQRVK